VSTPSRPAQRVVVELAAPDQPADHGLAALGLIMTLVGSVMAPLGAAVVLMSAYGAVVLDPVHTGGGQMKWAVLVGGAGVARSLIQRRSGIRLWRIVPGDPPVLSGINLYALAAAAHTAVWLVFMSHHGAGPGVMTGSALVLMAWPIALASIIRLPRYRRLAPHPSPGEDNGFEGLAVLMAVLGAAGLLFALMLVVLGSSVRGGVDAGWMSNVVLVTGLALSVRAVLQLRAGVKGVRGDALHAVNDFGRYGSLGTTLGGAVGGLITLWMLVVTLDLVVLLVGISILLALLAWPTTVRRFVAWRHLADLDADVVRRRSPDAGITALGWFLLGLASLSLAQGAATEIWGTSGSGAGIPALTGVPLLRDHAWWQTPLAALELWAALELLAVSDRRKLVATVWAVVALGALALQLGDGFALLRYGPLVSRATIWCAILLAATPAAATLLLVHRKVRPQAVARVAPRQAS